MSACLRRADRLLQQVVDELLELRARQLHLQVLRAALIGGDERQVDVGLHHRGELHLGLLRRFLQALQRHPILAEIDAVALPELGDDPLDDALIEVVAAEVRVAVGRLHLDDALADFENRDVERAAAEVVDGDRLVLLLVEPVRQRRRGRLVDDAHHLEAGNLAGFLRRLALRVVEVGGNRDDGFRDRLAEVLLRGLLQLLQDHRGDLRRRVFLVAATFTRTSPLPAAMTVYGTIFISSLTSSKRRPMKRLMEKMVFSGIGHRLALGDLADEPLARLGEGHDRRRQPAAFGVGDDDGLAAFHDGHDGVGGAQVDADDFAHVCRVLLSSAERCVEATDRRRVPMPAFRPCSLSNLSELTVNLSRQIAIAD